MENRTREKGTGAARLNMLGQQLDQYSATFGDLCSQAVTSLNEGQREINREFVPAITEAMEPAYSMAAEERGTGCFKRMKGRMHDHVNKMKSQMFQSASQQVRQSLLKLCGKIEDDMLGKADEVYLLMHRDYSSVMGTVTSDSIKLSREERVARRDVDQVISVADKHFQEVIDRDAEELKGQFSDAEHVQHNEDPTDGLMEMDDFVETDDEQEEEKEVGQGEKMTSAIDGSSAGEEHDQEAPALGIGTDGDAATPSTTL